MALIKVQTNKGTVVGRQGEFTDCSLFLGIPYAKPPVGELRFAAPEPAEPWEGEKECFAYGASPIQGTPRPPMPTDLVMSEDCLTLNVFTPAKSSDEKLPVMFWIFGGGFFGGTSADPHMYGESLTQKGVIVVTVNYRVGVLGFCALPELEAQNGRSVNAGILDQNLALKWVQENIAAFGGDPDRVLVHGQSAGGMSTRMHLTSPLAKGLFSRAVIQSGGGLNEADPIRPKAEFTAICERAMKHLEWTFSDLMTRDAQEVYDSMNQAARDTAEGFEVGFFQPFIDEYSIVGVPGQLISKGEYMDIPIICGTVCGDAWMFSRKVKDSFPEEKSAEYFKGFATAASQAWAQDNLEKGRTPIYAYFMDRTQPAEPDRGGHNRAPMWGRQTPHSSEIPYVFGTLERKSAEFTDYDRKLSDVMQTYWTNFAKTGDPNGGNLPQWPKYEKETPLTMHFGDEGYQAEDMVTDPIQQECYDLTKRKPGLLCSMD
jgi:para-nitrobenzyl esterase